MFRKDAACGRDNFFRDTVPNAPRVPTNGPWADKPTCVRWSGTGKDDMRCIRLAPLSTSAKESPS